MPAPRPPWLIPLVATAAVLAAGIGLAAIAVEPEGSDPAGSAPAAADAARADRDVLLAAPETGAGVSPSSPGGSPAGECSSDGEVPPPDGAPSPPGVTLWRGVFATFARPDDRRAVRAAVAEVAGVAPREVSCTEPAVVMADAPAAARSAPAVEAGAAPASTGSGSCFADRGPAHSPGLPEGAVLRVSGSGEYPRRGDEGAVRAAVAVIAGVPPERVECSYYVPPIGSCQAELAPAPGDPQVPDGAMASGFVGGDYTARSQVEGLRAALAAMAGLEPADIACADHADMPLPVDPGPGGIEPAPLPARAAEAAASAR